ncbi:MAG: hypothetical protein SFZ23_15605 [Planctomycetota bacterium]|nr:hypothetical protein [Planctomycetota bacterium]
MGTRHTNPEDMDSRAGGEREPFHWGRFFRALAACLAVMLVGGLVAAIVLGREKLETKATEVIQRTPPRITFVWPPLRESEAAQREREAAENESRQAAEAKRGDAQRGNAGTGSSGARVTPAAQTTNAQGPGASGPVVEPKREPRTWLPAQFRDEIQQIASRAIAGHGDVLSPVGLRSIGDALAASGWFDGQPRVMRTGANEITIDGAWRIPAGVVRWDGKDRMISWSGKAMPPAYEKDASGLPLLLGVATGPAVGEGVGEDEIDFVSPWPGEQVQAALELLGVVQRQPWSKQIAGIDVSSYGATRQLWLRTTFDTSVLWGGMPSKPLLGEPPTSSKLATLSEIFRRFRRVDAGKKAIDVSSAHPVEINISATARPDPLRVDGEPSGTGTQPGGGGPR